MTGTSNPESVFTKQQRIAELAKQAEQHRLLAEHLTAEYRVRTEGRGRVVDEWKQRPEKFDNHWLDCLVGCAVAASMQGAVLLGMDGTFEKPKVRKSFAAMQKGKR
jgi:hypothetical protein